MIRFSTTKKVPINQIQALRSSVKWRPRATATWKKLLKTSSRIVTAWDGKQLIGFGRIADDGVMCMFYDLVIHPDYQGKGTGEKLMKKLIDYVKGKKFVFIGLFVGSSNRSAVRLYKKLGFRAESVGMQLSRYMDMPPSLR
jgi:ribosomal protein S18 acetylase RimI-like enzyme